METTLRPKTLTPSEHQLNVVSMWESEKSLLLRGDTGSGKTFAAVLGMIQINKPVNLIVAPLHTRSGWERTLLNEFDIELKWMNSTAKGKDIAADLMGGLPGFYFVGREYFRNFDWKHFKKVDTIVLDEVHFISNRKSKSFDAALSTVGVPYRLGMSATPAGNKFEGLYSVTRWLFPDHVPKSYWKWVDQWCETGFDPFAYKAILGELNPGEYVKSLPAYYEMPTPYTGQPVVEYIDVDLTPTQRKIYKALEEEAILWFDEHPTFVDLPSSLYMRLLQTTLAVPKIEVWVDDEGKEHSTAFFPPNTKSTKIDIFLDLLKDIPEDEAIICYTHSKIFAELLTDRLVEKNHDAVLFDSAEAKKYIEGLGKDYRILVATQQAIGEGTDGLQNNARYEVWFSFSDNRLLNKQAAGRLNRQGQTEQVYRYVIRAKDTVETNKQHPRLVSGEELLEQSFEL